MNRMSRIDELFAQLRSQGKKALMPFVTAGDPDLEFTAANMVAANLGLALLTLVFSALALAVGAVTGKRAFTIGLSAAVTVFVFFVNGMAPLVDSLSWAQKLSPFYWLQGPNRLANGFSPGYSALMVVVTGLLLGVAVWGINRRDIDV